MSSLVLYVTGAIVLLLVFLALYDVTPVHEPLNGSRMDEPSKPR